MLSIQRPLVPHHSYSDRKIAGRPLEVAELKTTTQLQVKMSIYVQAVLLEVSTSCEETLLVQHSHGVYKEERDIKDCSEHTSTNGEVSREVKM